ncbi:hypothetical protein AB0G98_21700 [Streptomyces sp. NPDC020196]|uniref:hypothetical protein n=1 Tax=Streptomyces sp. NPDC020196 TaxID=3156656 RepID=UPI0033C7536B
MSDLHNTLDDFDGLDWIPGLTKLLDGIQDMADAAAAGQFTLDATQTTLSLLANPNGPDLPQTLALLAAHLTNPDTNPTLTALDHTTRKTVQLAGEHHAHDTAEYTPRDHPNHAAGLIDEATRGGAPVSLTDDEKKAMSEEVRRLNKQSSQRPR